MIFPNHPTGAIGLALYLEALSDLSPEQLEAGCREASRTAEQFPKPGHIRNAVGDRVYQFLGPPMLTYPEISQEERDGAVAACKEKLGKAWADTLKKLSSDPVKKKLDPRPEEKGPITVHLSKLSIEEQKQILKERGFLK